MPLVFRIVSFVEKTDRVWVLSLNKENCFIPVTRSEVYLGLG